MPVFSYKARDMNGLLVLGQIEGDGIEPVREMLDQQGLIPLSVSKGKQNFNKTAALSFLNNVSSEELMLFTKQFHTLFKAGMDMGTLLTTLANQTKNKFFADSINRIKADVANGSSLARAFSQHPKIFNDLYTNMLETGEEAGILDEVLGQICMVQEKELSLKSSVKSATLYPKIVMFVLVGAAVTMMMFVVPKFEAFFAHYNAPLPLPTRILMGTSYFITTYWYICLGICGAIMFAYKKWTGTTQGKLIVDRIKWKLPVFGPLGQKVANARFAHILGSLYRSGLPITRGLEIAAKTIEHEAFARDVLTVKNDVEKGRGIAESMREMPYFSSLLVEATAIGEKSGALDDLYGSVGSHYDMEVQHTLKNLTTLIEPIMLFLVFGMVVTFALAIFLPMWSLSKVVGGH